MADEADINDLKQKRGIIKGQLTRFQTLISSFTPSKRFQIESRLERCNDWWKEFQTIQFQIEKIDKSSIQEDERVAFEENFHDIISEAKRLLSQCSVDNIPEASKVVEQQVARVSVNLAPIDLPKFDGSYQNWISFRDAFHTMIDSNKNLSPFQKFVYLKGSLTGKAAGFLENLAITDNNYKDAVELLKLEYENKKIIAYSHLEALDELQVMTKESHEALNKFVSEIRKNLRGLKNLEQNVDDWDTYLIFQLQKKLDTNTKRAWKQHLGVDEFPNMNQFLEFLSHRSKLLEPEKSTVITEVNKHANNQKYSFNKGGYSKLSTGTKTFFVTDSYNGLRKCILCKSEFHPIFACTKFLGLNISSRRVEVQKGNFCWNCLKSGHRVQNCRSRGCKYCGKKHNSLLHEDKVNFEGEYSNSGDVKSRGSTDNRQLGIGPNGETDSRQQSQSHVASGFGQEVLLSTALVNVEDAFGNFHECRALLDSGSQSSFITSELSNKLKLPLFNTNISLQGIGQNCSQINHYINGKIKSRFNNKIFSTSFLVMENISGKIPSVSVNTGGFVVPDHIVLADDKFAVAGKIDMLLGAAIFWDLLCEGKIAFGPGKPIMQKTQLGWVIAGPTTGYAWRDRRLNKQRVEVCNVVSYRVIQEQLEKFWSLEECGAKEKQFSHEEEMCENIFLNTTKRGYDGKFIVKLPVRENGLVLGDSYKMALKRFLHLERKLSKDEKLKEQYHNFMGEFVELKHMTKLEDCFEQGIGSVNYDRKEVVQGINRETYFLPHHAVFKASSSTTKCRVVFDASAQSDNGVSLNNRLMVGPKLQDDIFEILLRFRKYKVALTADIAKMYRQVWVQEDQRELQQILWRFSADEPISVYQLNTVTYGTAPASFLAVRCLQQLGHENKDRVPEAAHTILKDFYMDDLLSGAESTEAAKGLKDELSIILNSAGFPLRKWMSNKKEAILSKDSGLEIDHYISDDGSTHKTLGLYWNSEEDTLHFQIGEQLKGFHDHKTTKRTILSSVAQIFDPLGILGPVVLRAKCILQTMWKQKIGWDEEVTGQIGDYWSKFCEQMDELVAIRVPRRIICDEPTEIQLHCFSDASEKAYGACVYIRSTDSGGKHCVRLVCSKSRVAPLKIVTLPRLELCGAVISSRLFSSVIKSLNIMPSKVFFWCDSTIVLAWLAGEPVEWKTFVSNRVSEIQSLTKPHKWYHIRSNENPADVISRGLEPNALYDCELWWHGPTFLSKDEHLWLVNSNTDFTIQETPEKRTIKQVFVAQTDSLDLFNRYSGFSKMQRIIAYCLRFRDNCLAPTESRVMGLLGVGELEAAKLVLLKLAQAQCFGKEIRALGGSRRISKNSRISSLNPFIDNNGLLRVGGRLDNSELSFNQRHPIILSNHHRLTKLIIIEQHYKNLHAGPKALLAAIRMEYWPLSGLNTVKRVLKSCTICFRVKPKSFEFIMGNLPKSRVVPSRPFSNCGVDFAGPFEIRTNNLRGGKLIKFYMCAFVCFATKAVHLEAVGGLSTEAFLNCFKRFISRRGLPFNMYSDNATNFIGTNNTLRDLYNFLNKKDTQVALKEYFSGQRVHWHFTPSRSAHFGRLWESVIKSAKYHIKRVVGMQRLTYEEFNTLLTQVEACLNSRPLLPMTENLEDLNVLTPGHFLIGTPLNALPQRDLSEINSGRLSRYQLVTQMFQSFWTRWSRDYLSQLQQRPKWRQSRDDICCGDLVILKDDNLPPLKWQLGRVVSLHPGTDNQCRVVSVKVQNGIVKRALSRVCVFPKNDF